MNLFPSKATRLHFDCQIQNPEAAALQAIATKQELIFSSFNQPCGCSLGLTLYLAQHSKVLAHTHKASFFEVINSWKLIYKISRNVRIKTLPHKVYSRLILIVKTTVKL